MLNKKISFRELALLAFLILFVAYYFVIQVPVSRDTQELNSKLAEVQSETDIAMAQLVQMKSMEKTVESVESESTSSIEPIPEYNNINNIISELNQILGSKTTTYTIDFSTVDSETPITRRTVPVVFNTDNYDAAIKIIESINASPNKYLINSLQITEASSGEYKDYAVNMNLTCFEYKN